MTHPTVNTQASPETHQEQNTQRVSDLKSALIVQQEAIQELLDSLNGIPDSTLVRDIPNISQKLAVYSATSSSS